MRRNVALAGTFVLIAAACAPKESATVAKSDSSSLATAAATATTPSAPNVVTVHAKDFAYGGVPAQIPAGMTTFNLINDGHTLHHIEIVRLDSGKTMANFEAELAKPAAPPAWAVFEGGPNAPDPGGHANATLDLQPGSYAMICLVDMPGGVPHFAKGMVQPFTVTAATGPASAPPTSDMTIALSDYTFTLSGPLKAGTHAFAVKNAGTQMHEVELARLAPGKTLLDVTNWLAKPVGPPPVSAVGGVAPFTKTTTYFTASLAPGNYALICFVPDAKDGKPHFMHGMMKQITVI
ncbi:MAG TPA: hypothetical protein VIG47_06095 [Gemmatimonadaceae bacterium]|jgi:hypothetical protein